MHVTAYLSFNGQCEEAFTFYAQCLGGQLGAMFRYAGSPMADTVPAEWQTKIMHGGVTVGELALMGADVVAESYEVPRGFSLSVNLKDAREAERIFDQLTTGGRVVVALEKTFWAERFGMLVDRFGVPWMINCEGAGQAAVGT